MASFAPIVDVENLTADQRGQHLRRMAGHLEDNRTIAIATMETGGTTANIEMRFDLSEAHALALAALSGDRRALTTPGIARILSATVAILFRVCLTTGGLQAIGTDGTGNDGTGHLGDQPEAGGDEGAGD